MKKTLLILIATVFTVPVLHAQKTEVVANSKPGWHKIGDVVVDFKSDKDAFVVMGKDIVSAIQIRVKDADVRLEDMQVSYDNGEKEDISVRDDFKRGSESRVIDLKNATGGLNKVTFYYKTVSNTKGEKAHLELWGLKPEVVTNNNPGWHKIGDAVVAFKSDKDAFVITGKDKFKAIQIKVKDAAVHLEDMQVSYDNGEKEDISVRDDFKPGSESRIIDLKKGTGGLDKVTFHYKTASNMKAEKAHLELWGLK